MLYSLNFVPDGNLTVYPFSENLLLGLNGNQQQIS